MQKKFRIEGMSCSACSAAVERAVSRLDGVEKAEVNLLAATLLCTYDDKKLSAEDVKKAVYNAGFTAYDDEQPKEENTEKKTK